MQNYLELLRVKHYIKNLLIFAPLFFGGQLFDTALFFKTLYAAATFSVGASLVYIVNDINDAGKDRLHPQKCSRPVASGRVSLRRAKFFCFLLMCAVLLLSLAAAEQGVYPLSALLWLLAYIALNLLYSGGLKNIPLLDLLILAAGFVIRLYYGSCVSGIELSPWICLTVWGGAFYLGIGKRRNELQNLNCSSRSVLKNYSYSFLDKNMYVCLAFTEVCYALWTIQSPYRHMVWSVPVVMLIFMKYSLDVEDKSSDGNPVDILLRDKSLACLTFIYLLILFAGIYHS